MSRHMRLPSSETDDHHSHSVRDTGGTTQPFSVCALQKASLAPTGM